MRKRNVISQVPNQTVMKRKLPHLSYIIKPGCNGEKHHYTAENTLKMQRSTCSIVGTGNTSKFTCKHTQTCSEKTPCWFAVALILCETVLVWDDKLIKVLHPVWSLYDLSLLLEDNNRKCETPEQEFLFWGLCSSSHLMWNFHPSPWILDVISGGGKVSCTFL